ncbi:hypothetical protein Tco_1178205 [Tanacetum coccineum]
MAMRTQPTLSPGMSARIAKAVALSPSSFRNRYRSSYEIPSPSSSLTLPIRKRYRGTLELVEDTKDEISDSDTEREGSENEGPSTEEEEAAPEDPQQAVPVVDTTVDEPSGLGFGALRRRELALVEGSMPSTFEIGESYRSVLEQHRVEEIHAPRSPVRATWVDPVDGIIYTDITIYVPPVCIPVQTPTSPEWSSGSLPVSPSSPAVPTLVASPMTTPVATIAVDEDGFLENTKMQCELQELRDRVTILEREGSRTDNQEKDEKQSQNNKTGLGMEKL